MKKSYALMLFGIVFTAVNSMLLQQWKINRLSSQVQLAEMQSNINVEWTNELLWARINDVHTLTKDQLVAQGRVEGIVSYLSGDNTQEIHDLWHEGYMRGLSQTDYQYEVIADSSYEKGYHAAMKDAFPDHTITSFGFANETLREVETGAIKTPEFDENNENLESNEEVINRLDKDGVLAIEPPEKK